MADTPEILVVENDRNYQILYSKLLQPHSKICVATTDESRQALTNGSFVAVVANSCSRYGERLVMDGLSLLRYARSRGLVAPFILLVEAPDELIIREADNYGAFEVIEKSSPDFDSRLLNSISIATDFYEYQRQRHGRHKDICEALCQIPNVYPIAWDYQDENLYESFFEIDSRSNQFCYANSWAYICQAARRNGHKFFDGATLITIEASVKKGAYEFEIIRPLGQQAAKKAFQLAEKLKTLTNRPIVFKRLEPDQFKSLQQRGCKILENPTSGILEDYFDDIYPQVVIDLNGFIFNLNMPEMAWFRRGLRQFTRRNYIIMDLKPFMYNDVREVLSRWKKSFVNRYQKKSEFKSIPLNDSYYLDPYLPFIEHFGKSSKRHNNIATIFYVDNKPVGFSLLVRVSKSCMAMYANVGDTYFEGLANFMVYQNFLRALWAGYSYINLGGTESKSLFDFYNRLTGSVSKNPFTESCFLLWHDLTIRDFRDAHDLLRKTIEQKRTRTKMPIANQEIDDELLKMKISTLFEKISTQKEKFNMYYMPIPRNQTLERKYLTY